jgi:hypothetical protein
MTPSRRPTNREIFEIGMAQEATQLRAQARLLPPGALQDEVLRKARLAETASHGNAWVTSSGLQAPDYKARAPPCRFPGRGPE